MMLDFTRDLNWYQLISNLSYQNVKRDCVGIIFHTVALTLLEERSTGVEEGVLSGKIVNTDKPILKNPDVFELLMVLR